MLHPQTFPTPVMVLWRMLLIKANFPSSRCLSRASRCLYGWSQKGRNVHFEVLSENPRHPGQGPTKPGLQPGSNKGNELRGRAGVRGSPPAGTLLLLVNRSPTKREPGESELRWYFRSSPSETQAKPSALPAKLTMPDFGKEQLQHLLADIRYRSQFLPMPHVSCFTR